MFKKEHLLFTVLGGFFVTNALIAEFIGVKIFALEDTLGIPRVNWNLFGEQGSMNLTAGVLLWPIVFIMTDIINEYYGQRGVRFLSYLAAVLIGYAFIMVYGAIGLKPADWWLGSNAAAGVPDMQLAYQSIFGQGNWIIVGSMTAFLISQLVDAWVFQRLRVRTGRQIWLRATASTLVSQFFDSFVVLYIAFVLGPQHWSVERFLAVGIVQYVYKFIVAWLMIPVLYGLHALVRQYLGAGRAESLSTQAADPRSPLFGAARTS
ncbi:MAG: queuosine precursor transporter [Bacteroidia bacterium]|nr:queuosine precursor transporter [Bacteroidia bacterium]